MTKARQYFKAAGWGSIKRCAIGTGYDAENLCMVILHKRKCSLFFAQCIVKWTNGELSVNDFLIGKGAK